MGDQGGKIEGHVDAGIRLAEEFTVQGAEQRQVKPTAIPGIPQFIGSYGDRREGRGRLGLEEAEALAQFAGDQVSQ